MQHTYSKLMKVCLINLPLLGLRNDLYGNIPSFPIGVCYLAAFLRQTGYEVTLIDMYGLNPTKKTVYKGRFDIWGITIKECIEAIPKDCDIIGISAHSIAGYSITKGLISEIKKVFKKVPVIIGGGCATTLSEDFIKAGADYIILGEGEYSFSKLLLCLQGKCRINEVDGIVYRGGRHEKKEFIDNLDLLPYPAFDLLPLENYWNLGYAHGPVHGKYLTLISSRGCPFRCAFCASPFIWQRKWRARSAENVVAEIEFFSKTFEVTDFHFQDDAFTINRERVLRIAELIYDKKLGISWSLPAGVKVEMVDKELLSAMKKSGFKYMSVSPESGSNKVLGLMKKPFDHGHMLKIAKTASDLKIFMQACFVLGFPGERASDILKTALYIVRLAMKGIDEIACYIMTPLPGAECFSSCRNFVEYEDLNFSPKWRRDFKKLDIIRLSLYCMFFIVKLLFHPLKFIRSLINITKRRFDTKFEMTIYRAALNRLSFK